jgi:hypothetical protein
MKSMNAFFLLPSIKDRRILEITNINVDEARDFLDYQSLKLVTSSGISVIDYLTGLKAEVEFLRSIKFQAFFEEIDTNNIAYQPLYEQVLTKIKNLVNVSVNGHKYRRAVYADLDANFIAIGTTLVGSEKGYISYYDANLNNELAGIQSYIDKYSYQDTL